MNLDNWLRFNLLDLGLGWLVGYRVLETTGYDPGSWITIVFPIMLMSVNIQMTLIVTAYVKDWLKIKKEDAL